MTAIEVKNGVVFKDGDEVGTYSGGNFLASKFLHHKTASAITKHLSGEKGEEEPEKDPMLGDLTPEYIEWHKANKSPEENEARYGRDFSRLTRGEHVFPEGFKH